jgi:hypothetical protein
MKANSAECKLSPSLTKAEDKSLKIKRNAWQHDGDFVLMKEQIAMLSSADRKTIEQIATKVYGNRVLKGQ